MSLIGIDLGTSAIKVVAFATDGTVLADSRQAIRAYRPEPGQWEVDVAESLEAFRATLGAVAADPALRRDPALAISFSSSGREVFPVAADGTPLGRCLTTADTRGDGVAAQTAALHSPEEWFRFAGHVPRRMDPVNRALWWRQTDPGTVARARWFCNWHEYYSLLLSGRPVVDWSDAGTWAAYDLASNGWSDARIFESGIERSWLPEIQPNGVPIGRILPEAARAYGLPDNTLIVTGAYDTYAAAVGSGAIDPGVVALACGTWLSFTMAVRPGYSVDLVHDGVVVYPHPGSTGLGLAVSNPNGMSVVDWARELVQLSVGELDSALAQASAGPGYVFANPTFTPLPHVDARPGFGGTLDGLTLAASGFDVVRALLEGIACDLSLSLDLIERHGVAATLIRANGGGARSDWLMQLVADVSQTPVEVVTQEEPGAFGAAILAGVGVGLYGSVSEAVSRLVRVARHFEPDPARGALYDPIRERIVRSRIQTAKGVGS